MDPVTIAIDWWINSTIEGWLRGIVTAFIVANGFAIFCFGMKGLRTELRERERHRARRDSGTKPF